MRSVKSEAQGARRQLDRILGSSGFARNERLSGFLRFIVERYLEGRDREIKESVIAVEVFRRRPDFDPRQDPVVRTEAARLRARLAEYYADEGKADALVIELPKGGYVPRFREISEEEQATAATQRGIPARFGAGFRPALGLACLIILVATAAGWWIQQRNAPIAIAVLPLENTSHDPANDYFADGLTDELIRNLSVIDGLAVRSRTSSFGIKGRSRNIREAGQQLQADFILEGSVLSAGRQLRIDVQLVRVHDDFSLWSARFDRELTDVFVIQDEIALGIVNNLRLKLGRGRRRYETSAEAYDLYLQARALPDQRNQTAARKAAGLYEQVIAKDPAFAPAYAGLAAAYAALSAQGFESGHGEDLARMRAAAEKAIRFDPLLPEAHEALAMEYARDGQWAQAERSFRRALDLNPSDSLASCDMTMYILLPLGRLDEALRRMRAAGKADPPSPFVQNILGWTLIFTGRYEEAVSHCQKAVQAPECLGRARLGQGRIDEAIQILDAGKSSRSLGAYGRAGRREEAEKLAVAVAPNAFSQALIYAGLGDKDRALQALERVADVGAVRIGRALNSPEFALLRGDPRATALRKRVGLPE